MFLDIAIMSTSKAKSRILHRRGFTFMEIMLVVVIIGILSSVVVPSIIRHLDEAKVNTTISQMRTIDTALTSYYIKVGCFPTTAQGLEALRTCPGDVDPAKWGNQPFFSLKPRDGWRREFIYRSPGEHNASYDLFSPGNDGQEGTADDLVNWEIEGSVKNP